MRIYNQRLITLFSFLLFFSCFAINVRAAGIPYMDKAKIRISVAPGNRGYGEILMENPDVTERTMRLYLEDWYYLPAADGSKEFVAPGTYSRSCAPWITFSPAEFKIAPFGKQRINYSIKVPEDAVGGYYTALFFETLFAEAKNPEGEMSVGIDLRIRVATLLYIEADGTVKRKAVIDNLKFENNLSSGKVLVKVDFANTGNVDITADGKFHIMDENGIVCARGEFNEIYTFPGDKAKLAASWKKPLSKGKYDLVATFNLGKALEETGFGRGPMVTKEASIEIGSGGEVLKVGPLE